ncbi:MAG: MATE family efflux transporter [Clostridia bacterium]|nr:MATE family efflux transporter [Clostridia bacterium]
MFIKKYIGDREFYKMVLTVAVPIILQNFITNLVNMLDNIMVGTLGTEQMSGDAIVNQLIFVFNLSVFGSISGAGIFTSQYYGKNDMDGIRYTIRFKAIVCGVILLAAYVIFLFGGSFLINLYLHDGSYDCDPSLAMEHAKGYLKIMLIGFAPYVASQVFAGTLKETGQTFVPMLAGIVAVIVNTLLNYLLIFGIGFFPELGVRGAAWGTVVSRLFECLVIFIYLRKAKAKHTYFKGSLRRLYIPIGELKAFVAKGIPLLCNELVWAVGMSLLTMCYSTYGLAVVAGHSIATTVLNLLNITFRSLGITVGIIAGQDLGANEFERAQDNVRKLNFFAVLVSVAIGVVAFVIADYVPLLYNVSTESKKMAVYFIKAAACFMPFLCYENSSYFTLRAGGQVLITSLFDGFFVLFVSCTIAFVAREFAPVAVTFVAVQFADVLKATLGFVLLRSKIWVRNLVEKN